MACLDSVMCGINAVITVQGQPAQDPVYEAAAVKAPTVIAAAPAPAVHYVVAPQPVGEPLPSLMLAASGGDASSDGTLEHTWLSHRFLQPPAGCCGASNASGVDSMVTLIISGVRPLGVQAA